MLAGGSALNCLLAVPSEYKDRDKRILAKWLGPDTAERDYDTAEQQYECKYMSRAKSGYGGSDVDLFITGLSKEEATEKLDKIIRHICKKLSRRDTETFADLLIVRTQYAVTIWASDPFPKFQVCNIRVSSGFIMSAVQCF